MGCVTSSDVRTTNQGAYPRQQAAPYPVQAGGPVYARQGYQNANGYIGAPRTTGGYGGGNGEDAILVGAMVGYGAAHMMHGGGMPLGMGVEGPMGVDIM